MPKIVYHCPGCGKKPEIIIDECRDESILIHSCDLTGNVQIGSPIGEQVLEYWNHHIIEKMLEGLQNGC